MAWKQSQGDLVSMTLVEHLDQDVPEAHAAPNCFGQLCQYMPLLNFSWGVCHSQGLNNPGPISYSILM